MRRRSEDEKCNNQITSGRTKHFYLLKTLRAQLVGLQASMDREERSTSSAADGAADVILGGSWQQDSQLG